MTSEQFFSILIYLLPLTAAIIYFDVKHRRIPNKIVLISLFCGLATNILWHGWSGFLSSIQGCGLGFGLMLLLYFFGAMGAGDVKLFGAIGAIVGIGLVFQTFLIVVMLGGVLAVISMIHTGTVKITLYRVLMMVVGLLPGWKFPRYEVTPDRHTIPYGVAITLGTLIALVVLPH